MLSVGFSRKHFGEGVDPIPTRLLETRIRLFNLKIQAILPQAFGSKWVSGKNRWKNTRGPYLTFQDVRGNHFQQPSQVELSLRALYHPTKVPNLTLGHPSTMPSWRCSRIRSTTDLVGSNRGSTQREEFDAKSNGKSGENLLKIPWKPQLVLNHDQKDVYMYIYGLSFREGTCFNAIHRSKGSTIPSAPSKVISWIWPSDSSTSIAETKRTKEIQVFNGRNK